MKIKQIFVDQVYNLFNRRIIIKKGNMGVGDGRQGSD